MTEVSKGMPLILVNSEGLEEYGLMENQRGECSLHVVLETGERVVGFRPLTEDQIYMVSEDRVVVDETELPEVTVPGWANGIIAMHERLAEEGQISRAFYDDEDDSVKVRGRSIGWAVSGEVVESTSLSTLEKMIENRLNSDQAIWEEGNQTSN